MNFVLKSDVPPTNDERLAEYKARREEFVKEWCQYPDNDYAAYYGPDEANYIDARQNYYWYETQDNDQEWIDKWIEEMKKLPCLNRQAF